MPLSLAEVRAAHDRIRPFIHRTPVLRCAAISAAVGAEVWFKCENFQRVGAFKFRGATNAIRTLSDEEAARGVCTHSSGNHAAALALAARQRGIPAHIVMPADSPAVKQAAVAGYGGQITLCAPNLAAREAAAAEVLARTGATLIHPYNDERIIAGQGTAALELLEEQTELDAVLTPVGGGGLLAGTLLAVKDLRPQTLVLGCEPAGADDAYRSWQAGRIIPVEKPATIADGLRTSLGDKTFPIIQARVDEIAVVTEVDIRRALRLVLERMKIVVEPSAVVPLAAILDGRGARLGKRLGVILSGGNLDLTQPWA
jgi:threonine dehydratase